MKADLLRRWAWISVALLGCAFGVVIGVSIRDDASVPDRSGMVPVERCLAWFDALAEGRAELPDEHQALVRTLVKRERFPSDEEALVALWAMGRQEPCARAARFGFVGTDGSLGPGAIAILNRCLFYLSIDLVETDRRRAEAVKRECSSIDAAVGRDPDDFG